MRIIRCDIGHSGELHKIYAEYCRDKKLRVPKLDMWLWRFSSPSFFCLLFKHGKKQAAFVMGEVHQFYDEPTAQIEAVFIKRAIRGKIKTTRKIVKSSKDFLKNSLNVQVLAYTRSKPRERKL